MRKIQLLLVTVMLSLVIGLAPAQVIAAETGSITLYVVPAMTDAHILPTTSISSDYISSQVSVVASPGEFEPASFVVRANTNVSSLLPVATDFSGSAGTIDASNIDIRYVKVWWQAKPSSSVTWRRADQTSRVLFPELLVKDPNFVLRGDERGLSDQHNYVKKTDGTYMLVSDGTITGQQQPSVSAMPIKDSATLLPVNIPAGKNQQFWVTVHVPEGTPAGSYTSTISLGNLGSIAMNLTVLPIDLQASMHEHAVFPFWSIVSDASYATIGYSKTEQMARAELKDMYEHGVTTPIITTGSETSLRKLLQWMRETGFTTKTLYYNGLTSLMNVTDSDASRLATLKSRVQRIVSIAAEYGFNEVYIYGVDEASASVRYLERPNYEAVHSAGAKVYICSYTGTAAAVGDVLDLLVWPGPLSATEQAIMHSHGNKIMSYENPMTGVEKPLTYRRNYGLLLWQKDYDGGQSFAWHWVQGGTVWNDFAGSTYRAEVFAYPTINGVIDTIEWEGWREGADDMKYLTTLLKTIQTAKASGKNTSAAEAWVAQLKTADLTTKDLGSLRSTMVDYILTLSSGSSTDLTPPVITSIGHSTMAATTSITWTTNEQATSQVKYGTTSQLGLSTTLDSSLVVNHQVTLTGLDINSTYYFKVESRDAAGNLATSGLQTLNPEQSADVTPPVISSIGHSAMAATTSVTWTTDEQATSQVRYGTTSQLGLSTTLDSSLVLNHQVTLTGLDTNSTYYFKVESRDAAGNLATSSLQTLGAASSLSIAFIPPTNADTAVICNDSSQIATSLSTSLPASSFVDWNRSLVGYWDFNGNSGSIAYDKSTYGNNATLKNSPQWTTGKFGSALSFDGTDDYVSCGSNSSLNTTNAITVEAWVKTSKAGWNAIANKLVNPTNGFWFGTNSSGNLYMVVYNSGTSRISASSTCITDGAWHHVACAYDGTRTILYVDGNSVYTKDWGSHMAIGGTSGTSLIISSTGSVRFSGLIDEVRVWNRALSLAEIKASCGSDTSGVALNVTGLANGTYQYYAYATDTTGNSACTETRTLTVNFAGILGDVNGDQVVNTSDVTCLERIIAGLDVLTGAADANGDGKVNTADITTVERIIAGLS